MIENIDYSEQFTKITNIFEESINNIFLKWDNMFLSFNDTIDQIINNEKDNIAIDYS